MGYSSSGSDTILLTADEGTKHSPNKVKNQTHVSIASTLNLNVTQISSDDDTTLQTADELAPSVSSEEESCYLSCSSIESKQITKYNLYKDGLSYKSRMFSSSTTAEITNSTQPIGSVYVRNFSTIDDQDQTVIHSKGKLNHSSSKILSPKMERPYLHGEYKCNANHQYISRAYNYPSSISSDLSDCGWPSREETDSDNEAKFVKDVTSKIHGCDKASSNSDSTVVSSKLHRVSSLASITSTDSNIEGEDRIDASKSRINSETKCQATNKVFNFDPRYVQSIVIDMLQKQLASTLNSNDGLKLTYLRQNGNSTDQAYICIDQGKRVPVAREVFNEIVKLRQYLS